MPIPAAAGRAVAPLALLRDAGRHAHGARPALTCWAAAAAASRRPRHGHQQRWAQVHDVRFVATTQAPLRVLEKYRDKLDRKARAEGLAGIDQLKAAYAERIKQQRKADTIHVPGLDALLADEPASAYRAARTATTPGETPASSADATATTTTTAETTNQNPPATARPGSSSSSGSQVQPLSEIVNLPKLQELPVTELTELWRLGHASVKDSICAVVPAATYAAMEALARLRPQFILPVPHPDQGAEVHFLQWTFDAPSRTGTVLFTQLAEYKARGEFAQPHTTVTHYTDLAAAKGVVLMRGSVDGSRGVKVADAQWLLMCLQRFYGGWDLAAADPRAAERRKLLDWFATGDERFSVEKLLEETERLA